MPVGVQNPHAEGEKSHEKEIGKDDLVKRNGQLKFFWISENQSWRNDPNQNRREENSKNASESIK